jgi:tetratricopeptide (TPR) repeat protein
MTAEWEGLLDEAAALLDAGRHHDALQLCDRAAVMGEEARYHAAILRGDVLLDMGDPSGALSSYETVADPDEDDPEVDCARGIAFFELGQFAEAENALRSALRGDRDLAEAYYTLGLIAEIQGNGQEVELFRRARKLDPESFPQRALMSRQAFEAVVDEAVTALPEGIKAALGSLPLIIAELPHPDDVRHAEPPLSPLSMGMYVGPPPNLRDTVMDLPDAQQPAMVLFKRNLERAATDRGELVEEVRRTVMHELGSAMGLSDEEILRELGDLE